MNMLNLPKKVYFKHGSMQVALRELNEVYHLKRAFLVSDPALYRAGTVSQVDNWLRRQGIRTAEFFSLSAPPSFAEIGSALPKLLEFEPDVIVGIGGGSAMSAAKAMWMIYENPQLDLAAAVKNPECLPQPVKAKLVLVATNFGSGAQNSPFAVLRDDRGTPCVLSSFRMLPEISVTDAAFTGSLTAEQVKACGLATLARSARAYAAPGCTEYTEGLLVEAVHAVLHDLKYAESGCPVARERLHNAASLAGAAYGNVAASMEPEAPPFPTAAEKAEVNPRFSDLARELGFAGAAALFAACEALL